MKSRGKSTKAEKRDGQTGTKFDNIVIGERGCEALKYTHHATNTDKTLKSVSQQYGIVPGTNGMLGEVTNDYVTTVDVRKTTPIPSMHDLDRAIKEESDLRNGSAKGRVGDDSTAKYSSATLRLHALLRHNDYVGLGDVDAFLADFSAEILSKCQQKQETKKLVIEDEIQLEHDIVAINNVDRRAKADASGFVTSVKLVKTRELHSCCKCKKTIQAGTRCATSFMLTEESKKIMLDFEIDALENRLDNTFESVSYAKLPKKRVWVCSTCLNKFVEVAKDIELEYLEADAFDFDFEDD